MIFNFVLVNFNNSLITLNCIDSILQNNAVNKILIVDNKSEEVQIEILKKNKDKDDKVSLLFLQENIGYAAALNVGIDFFTTKYGCDQVLIIGNNDLTYDENFVSGIISTDYAEDVMIISPNIMKSQDGVHQNPFLIKKHSFLRKNAYRVFYSNYYVASLILSFFNFFNLLRSSKNRSNYSTGLFIMEGHGACYVLLPLFLRKCKLLDVPTFLYGEETFIGYQVRHSGGRIFYDPALKVLHNEHTSTGKKLSKAKFKYMQIAYKKCKMYY